RKLAPGAMAPRGEAVDPTHDRELVVTHVLEHHVRLVAILLDVAKGMLDPRRDAAPANLHCSSDEIVAVAEDVGAHTHRFTVGGLRREPPAVDERLVVLDDHT